MVVGYSDPGSCLGVAHGDPALAGFSDYIIPPLPDAFMEAVNGYEKSRAAGNAAEALKAADALINELRHFGFADLPPLKERTPETKKPPAEYGPSMSRM